MKKIRSQWEAARDKIHAEVCQRGFDSRRNTFIQAYGSSELDASLLRIPLVGFLPAADPRVAGTVEAIRHELTADGLLRRYRQSAQGEGAFLPCNFWLVDCLTAMDRQGEARKLFEALLALCNDTGLLSEEYDPAKRHMLGNFPQTLTHVTMILSALNLEAEHEPMKVMRGEG